MIANKGEASAVAAALKGDILDTFSDARVTDTDGRSSVVVRVNCKTYDDETDTKIHDIVSRYDRDVYIRSYGRGLYEVEIPFVGRF